mmetsp:Transcript_23083/g.36880  ORF Transcript_23083/g.36880 Transcript_23083/m.36880 type:complete len:183 (+) Transcript_23083:60-608(+)
MDALALLSDDDDEEPEDDETGATEELAASSSSTPAIDFKSLQKVGFNGSGSLCETEMYKRAGQADEKPVLSEAEVARAEEAKAAAAIAAADAAREEEERKRLIMQAAERDRKRAGRNLDESNRQKNARKMKAGQASFSLKDDRDCVNPFVDSSQAPHVQSYGGKRVDKRASVKQISNLDFTS